MGLLKDMPYSEVTATMEIFNNEGITREHLALLRKDPEFADQVMTFLIQKFLEKTLKVYPVLVDYGLSWSEMLKKANLFWASGDITRKRFPIQGIGQQKVSLVIVNFGDRFFRHWYALDYFTKYGLEAGRLEHLLALTAQYPSILAEQKTSFIFPLGTIWLDKDNPVFIRIRERDLHDRSLCLDINEDDEFGGGCSFLAIRKAA